MHMAYRGFGRSLATPLFVCRRCAHFVWVAALAVGFNVEGVIACVRCATAELPLDSSRP
jgi:hypothetical protein